MRLRDPHDQQIEEVKTMIAARVPEMPTEGRRYQWAKHFVNKAAGMGFTVDDQLRDFMEFAVGMLQDVDYGTGEPPPMPDELDADQRAAELAHMQEELRSAAPPCELPPNRFAVGVQGQYIVWLKPTPGKLHRSEAVNLAQWMLALASDDINRHLAQVLAILES